MTLYLDEVLALNTLINWGLLRMALTLTGQSVPAWRTWAAALLGGIYAMAAVVPSLSFLGSLPGLAAAFLAMAMLAFGLEDRALSSALWYLIVQLGFGGLVFAAAQLLRVPAFLLGGRVYYPVSPRLLGMLLGGGMLLSRLLLRRFLRHGPGELETLELQLGPRRVVCAALVDTGNSLLDPLTGAAVPVVQGELAGRLLPDLPLDAAALSDPPELLRRLAGHAAETRFRLLPYRAVGAAAGLLLGLRCDRVLRNGRPAGTLVALSPTALSDGGIYKALVPPQRGRASAS